MIINESFLHHIWKFKLFNSNNLSSTNGERIQLIQSGQHNTNAGPDFFASKIKIGDTSWVGNVEIHINSSDWYKHHHETDGAYDNVILHVVYHHDKEVLDKHGNSIPTIELNSLIFPKVLENYNQLQNKQHWIPCQKLIAEVDEFVINNWVDRLVIERLERKSDEILKVLEKNKFDWEETFYQFLFKYFGLKINAMPFFMLAQKSPLKVIDKHRSLKSVEALLFGNAGFLEEDCTDSYFLDLQKEYQFLKSKFNLQCIDNDLWKLMRLRPNNFPAIRISQLANLMVQNNRLFSNLIKQSSVKEIQKILKVSASKYWETHYRFGSESKHNSNKNVGGVLINNIIINVVVPFTFLYGKHLKQQDIIDKSIAMLDELNPEINTITKKYHNIGLIVKTAQKSQGLLEMFHSYCSEKRCLNCSVGNTLIKLT